MKLQNTAENAYMCNEKLEKDQMNWSVQQKSPEKS